MVKLLFIFLSYVKWSPTTKLIYNEITSAMSKIKNISPYLSWSNLELCLSVYLSAYLSISLSISLSIHLSITNIKMHRKTLSVCPSICLSAYFSIYLSITNIKMHWKTSPGIQEIWCFIFITDSLLSIFDAVLLWAFTHYKYGKSITKYSMLIKNDKVCFNYGGSIRLKLILLLSMVFYLINFMPKKTKGFLMFLGRGL